MTEILQALLTALTVLSVFLGIYAVVLSVRVRRLLAKPVSKDAIESERAIESLLGSSFGGDPREFALMKMQVLESLVRQLGSAGGQQPFVVTGTGQTSTMPQPASSQAPLSGGNQLVADVIPFSSGKRAA